MYICNDKHRLFKSVISTTCGSTDHCYSKNGEPVASYPAIPAFLGGFEAREPANATANSCFDLFGPVSEEVRQRHVQESTSHMTSMYIE